MTPERATVVRRRGRTASSPATDLNLLPGQSATFTVTITGSARPQPPDDGYVLWRGANGNRVRVPVVVAR